MTDEEGNTMIVPRFIYIAGPMRGLPEFNFPAFDEARIGLTTPETFVFSPACRDRSAGFDPSGMTGHEDLADLGFDLREALAADTQWICETATTMYMLKGWGESSGAKAEHALAQALGLEVWYESDAAHAMLPNSDYANIIDHGEEDSGWGLVSDLYGMGIDPTQSCPITDASAFCEFVECDQSPETWLQVADGLIHGERNADYGHPHDDFSKTAAMWTAFLGCDDIEPAQVAAMMIMVKLSRLSNTIDHEDSWVDIAGYVGCADRVQRRIQGLE